MITTLFIVQSGLLDIKGNFSPDGDGDAFEDRSAAKTYMEAQFIADKLRYGEEYKGESFKLAARLSVETTTTLETLGA